MTISRRQFGGYMGSGLAGIVAAHLPGGQAYAQGTGRVTHAISAGDISGLDPTLAWVSFGGADRDGGPAEPGSVSARHRVA